MSRLLLRVQLLSPARKVTKQIQGGQQQSWHGRCGQDGAHRAVTLTADQIATSWKGSEEPGCPRAPFPAYCLRHAFPDYRVAGYPAAGHCQHSEGGKCVIACVCVRVCACTWMELGAGRRKWRSLDLLTWASEAWGAGLEGGGVDKLWASAPSPPPTEAVRVWREPGRPISGGRINLTWLCVPTGSGEREAWRRSWPTAISLPVLQDLRHHTCLCTCKPSLGGGWEKCWGRGAALGHRPGLGKAALAFSA